MAISWIANAVHSTSPTADTTITLPTGSMAVNDLIIIGAAVCDTTNNALAAPTVGGYTDVIGSTIYSDDVNDVNLNAFYKYWNGTDTTAVFGDVGGSNASNVAVCQIFRGVATVAQGGPFSTTSQQASGNGTSNANPASIATATGDAVVIIGASGHTGGATATYTNPTNYTTNAAVRAHNDTIDGLVGMGYRLSGYSNPEDPGVFTAATIGTAADNAWAAITMALKEAPSAAVLSAQTVGSITAVGGTPAVDTNTGSGTVYMVVVPNGDSPTATQIKAGQQSSGAAALAAQNQAVSGTGTQTFSAVTGLTGHTAYDVWFVQNTGVDSNTVKADFTTNTLLNVDVGSYSITGKPAGLYPSVTGGAYTLTGTSSTLIHGYPIVAGSGVYTLYGEVTDFRYFHLSAASGAYSIVGAESFRAFSLVHDSGIYAITGTDADLIQDTAASEIAADSGTYTITGVTAGLNVKLNAISGSYSLSGTSASLRVELNAAVGSYSHTGASAGLYPSVSAGVYAISGTNATFKYGQVFIVDPGVYTLTGEAVTLIDSGSGAGVTPPLLACMGYGR